MKNWKVKVASTIYWSKLKCYNFNRTFKKGCPVHIYFRVSQDGNQLEVSSDVSSHGLGVQVAIIGMHVIYCNF